MHLPIQKTYEQQWQKLTSQYLEDKIKPYQPRFCICGNLCNGYDGWYNYDSEYLQSPSFGKHNSFGQYTGRELYLIEAPLLEEIHNQCGTIEKHSDRCEVKLPGFSSPTTLYAWENRNYEQALFDGFVKSLEVLRQIHLKAGDLTAEKDYKFASKRELKAETV